MKYFAKLLAMCLTVSVLSGCAMYSARFSPPVMQETKVILKEDDFRFVARNVEGCYGYPSLQLGWYPMFSGEIPLADPRLFSNAMADMYKGTALVMEGKPMQLVNWTLDSYSWYIPIPWITPVVKTAKFRADIMEYTK